MWNSARAPSRSRIHAGPRSRKFGRSWSSCNRFFAAKPLGMTRLRKNDKPEKERGLHAQSKTAALKSADRQSAGARLSEGALAVGVSELSRKENAAPRLPQVRILQGTRSTGRRRSQLVVNTPLHARRHSPRRDGFGSGPQA